MISLAVIFGRRQLGASALRKTATERLDHDNFGSVVGSEELKLLYRISGRIQELAWVRS